MGMGPHTIRVGGGGASRMCCCCYFLYRALLFIVENVKKKNHGAQGSPCRTLLNSKPHPSCTAVSIGMRLLACFSDDSSTPHKLNGGSISLCCLLPLSHSRFAFQRTHVFFSLSFFPLNIERPKPVFVHEAHKS
jgi:hypothetical protein